MFRPPCVTHFDVTPWTVFDEKVAHSIPDDGFTLEAMFRASESSDKYNTKVIPPTAGDNTCKYLDAPCTAAECGYCTGNYMPNYTCGPEHSLLNHSVNMDKVNETTKMDSPCLFYGYTCRT